MNHVLAVGGFQGATDLQHDARRLVRRKLALLLKQSAEVAALHEIHGDELDSVGLAQVKDSNDVFVRDLARENQFLLEPPHHFRIAGKIRTNQLEGHRAVELLVVRLVDGAHPPTAEDLKPWKLWTLWGCWLHSNLPRAFLRRLVWLGSRVQAEGCDSFHTGTQSQGFASRKPDIP